MKVNPKQMEAVLNLNGEKRYQNFIKVVADWEEVWGLYNDGWALAADDTGRRVFPLWPAEAYAKICSDNEWESYKPTSLSLEELMRELLPSLKNDGVLPGIFYTPTDLGVTPEVDDLVDDLERELSKY